MGIFGTIARRLAATLAVGLCSVTMAAAQAVCVSPGDILDVPTPGFLVGETPNLVIDFERGGAFVAVTPASFTSSRIRIQIPSVGLLPEANFKVRHIEAGGGTKVIATARTCDFTITNPPTISAGTSAASGSATLTPATRFEVAAPSGGPEYMLVGSPSAVSRAEGVILQAGGDVLRRRGLNALGLGLAVVDLRGIYTLSELRAVLARRQIDIAAGPHAVYNLGAGENDFARAMTVTSPNAACRLRRPVRIGMIDGPVNRRHPSLSGVAIEAASVLGRGDRSATPDHGTGVAGVIASDDLGFARGAALFSVTAVSRAGSREVAKLEHIAAAIDWMVSRKVEIVNISLAGPSNAALARAIEVASRRGVVLVAAVGNDRGADVAYPASDPNVIAVTAIDADKRLYRQASRGTAVDFAAPGVDLRVPIGRNKTAFRSGTSYASAALTALIAIEMGNGRIRNAADARRALTSRAEDLGPAGRDTAFGFGLARGAGC
jgi:hypothetical protein